MLHILYCCGKTFICYLTFVGEYVTTEEDWKSRMLARQARVEKGLADARLNVSEETEEEAT